MEQGFVENAIAIAVSVNNGIAQIVGIDPMLILSVVILVSMVDIIFKVRSNFPAKADLILLGSCMLMSVLISIIAIDGVEGWKHISRHAFVLSGITTLLYKVGKPILKYFVLKKLKKLNLDGG